MADQASMNGGAQARIDAPLADGVIGGLGELASDITTLAELQAQLAALDLKEGAQRAALPVAGLATAVALALAALPVLLLGVAELLVRYAGLERAWALVLTAVVVLALAGVLGWIGARNVGGGLESFRRSREELARNIAWIKTVLSHSGRSVPSQRRRI